MKRKKQNLQRERDKGRKKKEIERQFSLLRKGGRKNKYEE